MTSESPTPGSSHEESARPFMQHGVANEEDEEDVCRICRMPAEVDNALFFPCKCSGSIKYVHQLCLVEWLNHSGNTHCEVCKHKFSFTPVYAKDAPVVLPWYQLLFGLLKRGANAVRVAHRIWLVCSIWLVIVPLCTGLAWRIAFAQSIPEAAQIVLQRFRVLALITDCIQGSLLSITIVFLNMGFSSLKDYLRQCIRSLEQQLLHSLPAAHDDPAIQTEESHENIQADFDEAAGQPQVQADEDPAALLVGIMDRVAGMVEHDDAAERIPDENQAEIPFEELIGLQGPWLNFVETIALVTIGNAFFMFMAIWVPLNMGRFGLNLWKHSLQSMFEHHLMESSSLAGPGTLQLENQTAALMNASVEIAVNAVASAIGNATSVLSNTSGTVVNAAESVLPAFASLAAAGQLPGNVTVTVASNLSHAISQAAAVLNTAADPFAQPQCGLLQDLANSSALVLQAAADAVSTGHMGQAPPAHRAPVPVGAPANQAGLLGAGVQDPMQMYPIQPLLLMVMTVEQMLKELQAHLEPPPRADFVALGLGHVFLLLLAFVCLWSYVSVRLWNLHARRTYIFTQQSMWQVLNTATAWAMSTLAQVVKLLKLGILLIIELGLFPLATGVWLDLCLLPLTNSTMEQRMASFLKAPLLLAFVHWLLGVAFMLAFTFLVCMTREVLRPGALPFLKDPTNPERNPIREMMEEPWLTHCARVSLSCILYAALCVTLVHFPALLARMAMPQLFPLRLYFLDPFTQIPADMLLFHVCVPFTVEHVKVKALVKAVIRQWLRLVGWMLGLQDYLLPPADAHPAAAPPQQEQDLPRNAPTLDESNEVAAGASDSQAISEAEVPVDSVHHGDQTHQSSIPLSGSTSTGGSGLIHDTSSTSQATMAGADPSSDESPQTETLEDAPPSLASYEEQPNYPLKLLVMGLFWAATMVVVGAAFFVVPVSIGRFIFSQLHLLLKNDLYSGALGMYALWGLVTVCRSAVAMANFGNMSAALRAGWRWLVLIVKCVCLAILWLGVVATMLGILVELVLLPLHHNPMQSPLMFWYQDWTMGVLGLKLWHLVIMLTPRREGAPPPQENSWQAHFEALQRDGLMNLNFTRALRFIILPVMLRFAVAMAVPYSFTRVLLPYVPFASPKLLEYANLYAYTVAFVLYVAYKAAKQLHSWLNDLHNTIRDDWYLVGRELNNFLDAASGPGPRMLALGKAASVELIDDAGVESSLSTGTAFEGVVPGSTHLGAALVASVEPSRSSEEEAS